MSLIEHVFDYSMEYLESKTKTERKKIGQFFTSVKTAEYMSSLFVIPTNKSTITILDPGAGSGILTAALIDKIQETNIKSVHVVCYEINADVLPILETNLKYLKDNSTLTLTYEIRKENYITSQYDAFNDTLLNAHNNDKYDLIIGNPPYKKIPKDAEEAVSMPAVCYGAPNLYFLFWAMSVFNLSETGELVYIIPRSWTSGAYFKKFREYLFSNSVLKHVHLFVSRDKVFESESVLQETIIVKVDKNLSNVSDVVLTCSESNSDFHNMTVMKVPYDTIVNGSELYVYLITNEDELRTISALNKWKNTLVTVGLKMHTGLTVDFRSREVLFDEEVEGSSPILYSQHIKDGRINFPIEKDNQYICTDKRGYLQDNKNYLLCKRFTSKEEKRRLQCGIYLSSDLPQYTKISTQNKLNFIDSDSFDMSEELTYGLYTLFNSTIYDKYYRILNGSTQVNSTEVNTMPVPKLNEIESMGKALLESNSLSTEQCDKIIGGYIYG